MANDNAEKVYPALDFDRDRGIFTPEDRRFLAGARESELSKGGARHKRWRLRRQVLHALQDLAYLRFMDIDDIGQIAEKLQQNMTPDSEEDELLDGEAVVYQGRLAQATEEVLGLFREIHTPEGFRVLVERQLATRAALDHYDETGEYGRFEVSINVELKDEMSLDELKQRAKDTDQFLDLADPPYHGWWEVLDRAGAPIVYAEEGGVADFDPQPENPEQVETVVETIDELDSGPGASEGRVVRLVAEKEDISLEDAEAAVEDALISGRCFHPSDDRLRTI